MRAQTHELVWLEDGSAEATSDDLSTAMRPGSVLLSPQGSRTHYRWDPRVTTRHGYVLFRADGVERAALDLPSGDVVPALLRHLVHLDLTRPDGWYEHAQQVLSTALRSLAVPRTSAERPLSPVVLQSLSAVRRSWPQQGPWRAVPLTDLAAAAAVTPEHLCRAWRKDVGLSPVAGLSAIRLYRAAFLLTRSNISVGDVARVAGYDNPFHFSRAFKRTLGVSPTEFRTTGRLPSEAPAGLRAVMSRL